MGKKFKVLRDLSERQENIPGTEPKERDPEDDPLSLGFQLRLTIKDGIGGSDTLTVIAGKAPADRVEEIVHQAICSKRFQRKLRAVIGKPLIEPRLDEDKRSRPEQGEEVGVDLF